MSLREAVASTAAELRPASTATVSFLGKDRDYWRLLIRGALLLVCTLGIYRFWLTTDVRRFLWATARSPAIISNIPAPRWSCWSAS